MDDDQSSPGWQSVTHDARCTMHDARREISSLCCAGSKEGVKGEAIGGEAA